MRWTLLLLCTLIGCNAAMGREGPPADRILVNGNILTVDARDSIAEAVAIRDGKILAVGANDDIEALAGPATARIDLAGRTVTPGLIDTHAHFAIGGLVELTQVDLSYPQVQSVGDAVDLVAERARDVAQQGGWILGRGWDEGKLAERRYLVAADLDPVSDGRPVWLMHTTAHYGVADSEALEIAGIDRDTPDPPGGMIDRDAEGKPTGVLKETAMGLVERHVPAADAAQLRDAIRLMAREFNRECMTGAKDPGIGAGIGFDLENAMETWNAYRDVLAEGELTVRVVALWRSGDTLDEAQRLVEAIEPLGKPQDAGNDRLVSGGIKLFADGSGGARTAWVWDEWNRDRTGIDEGNRGYPALDPLMLRDLFMFYHDAGLHVGVHAIGDRAIDWMATSMAMALIRNPQHGLRHSFIHANIPSDYAIRTMAWLQRTFDAGYPESQANFTWWIGDTYAGNFGAGRSHRLNPFHTYKEQGVQWAGGSDFDVTPFPARYGIWASMSREPLLGCTARTRSAARKPWTCARPCVRSRRGPPDSCSWRTGSAPSKPGRPRTSPYGTRTCTAQTRRPSRTCNAR